MRRFPVLVSLVTMLTALLVLPAGAAVEVLDDVTVSGVVGEKPTVTFAAPLSVKSSVATERTAGTGAVAKKGSRLLLDYLILNGRDGSEVETSFGADPVMLVLDKKQAQPALYKGLLGATPGSRVLIAVAPKDGLAANGASVGVRKNDTLLFVLDVKDVNTPLTRASGAAVAPVDGLPTVKLAKSGKPTISMPKGAAPTALVVQPLIVGDGPVVQAGQTIDVHYTGALWAGGKVFDSSWARGQAVQFPIGTGNVITGWDEGLVGQTVGSQVLLVIPPDKGYGASGQPQAGIKGTDTLVFVVDILAAT